MTNIVIKLKGKPVYIAEVSEGESIDEAVSKAQEHCIEHHPEYDWNEADVLSFEMDLDPPLKVTDEDIQAVVQALVDSTREQA